MLNRQLTIGEYLLKKLESYGINHIFGIPGDYVVQFFDLIQQSPIQHRELELYTCARTLWRRKGIFCSDRGRI